MAKSWTGRILLLPFVCIVAFSTFVRSTNISHRTAIHSRCAWVVDPLSSVPRGSISGNQRSSAPTLQQPSHVKSREMSLFPLPVGSPGESSSVVSRRPRGLAFASQEGEACGLSLSSADPIAENFPPGPFTASEQENLP
jgi:hypothetical protein